MGRPDWGAFLLFLYMVLCTMAVCKYGGVYYGDDLLS